MYSETQDLLSQQIEEEFKHFFSIHYGLYIHQHQLDKLRQSILEICQKFSISNPKELLSKIKTEPQSLERILLIQKITVDESYFFRDETQQYFLKNVLLPELIAQKRQQKDRHLRIWSAGCSTGQEIYSIAILLQQLLIDFSDWKLHLIATDINQQSLEQAIKGEYSSWAIRTDENFMLNSGYFSTLENGNYQLKDFIRKQVKFFYLNLAENSFPSLMNQTCHLDIILCRNVFIYFEEKVITQTCNKFAQALKPNGVLILSSTDPMELDCSQFEKQKSEDVFYFRRKESSFDFQPEKTQQNLFVSSEEIKETKNFDEKKQEIEIQPETNEDLISFKKRLIALLGAHQWIHVSQLCSQSILKQYNDGDLYQFKAKALVNLGQLEAARQACEQSILLNDLDPHVYLLYGLILIQLAQYNEAEKAFRQTIFLNYDFMEAHYQLGQLLLSKGKQQGIKYIKNALKLAEKGDKNQPVHNVNTLNYGNFAQLIKNELSILKDD